MNPNIINKPIVQAILAAALTFITILIAQWLGQNVRGLDGYIIFSLELIGIRLSNLYVKKSDIPFFGD